MTAKRFNPISSIERLQGEKKFRNLIAILVLLLMLVIVSVLSLQSRNDSQFTVPQTAPSKYGQPLPWGEVTQMFPRYVAAVVEDLETGKRFEVTRRGGSYHADVQPLTAEDTKTMREIFSQGWTWRRRAIIVEIGGQRIAASMNGMPHGSGLIQGNDFSGHFCLHFLGCKVHKSGKVDPAHQMMVWKAAGQPWIPFQKADPRELIDLVFTAINQGDGELAVLGIEATDNEDLWLISQSLLKELPEIELRSIRAEESDPQQVEYELRIKILYPGEKSKVDKVGSLIVRLQEDTQIWHIEGKGLKELLTK